jgi:hypothetical protein
MMREIKIVMTQDPTSQMMVIAMPDTSFSLDFTMDKQIPSLTLTRQKNSRAMWLEFLLSKDCYAVGLKDLNLPIHVMNVFLVLCESYG